MRYFVILAILLTSCSDVSVGIDDFQVMVEGDNYIFKKIALELPDGKGGFDAPYDVYKNGRKKERVSIGENPLNDVIIRIKLYSADEEVQGTYESGVDPFDIIDSVLTVFIQENF